MWMVDSHAWVNLNLGALSFKLLRYAEWRLHGVGVQIRGFEALHERLRLCCVRFDY